MPTNEETTTALMVRHDSPLAHTAKGADYWITHFGEARTFCDALIKTGFLGQHIKTPEQAVMVMMAGDELGLPPTVAFRDLHVIHGQIGMKAKLMLSLVRSSSVCRYFRPVGDPSDTEVTFETLRAGEPEPVRRTFTIGDAVRAGYVKQNPKYQSDPKAMLSARCISILCDLMYGDITRGMKPAEILADEREEMEPIGDQAAPGGTPEPAAERPDVAAAREKLAKQAEKRGKKAPAAEAAPTATAPAAARSGWPTPATMTPGEISTALDGLGKDDFKATWAMVKARPDYDQIAPAVAESFARNKARLWPETVKAAAPPPPPVDPKIERWKGEINSAGGNEGEDVWSALNDAFDGQIPVELVQLFEVRWPPSTEKTPD